jgi:Bacterial membrane protein YfhO
VTRATPENPRTPATPAAPASPGSPGSPGSPVTKSGLSSALAYALAAFFVLAFFYPIVFGKVFLSPDSVAPAGFSKVAMDALHTRHVYALWNPYHFLGMPSFGSLAFVPYVYPLDPVFGFLNTVLHFPDLTWLLFHYLLIAVGMIALLRALGAGADAALLGAVAFALTPNLVAVGAFGHGSQIMTAAWLPLLFLLYDRFARRGSLLALAGFAFAAAFQLLRGHVQIVFYSWLALGLYALWLAIAAARAKRGADAARAAGGLAAGLALGFGMSAFLYFPVHEYAKLSIRSAGEGSGAGFEYATSWSFHPKEMLTFVVPSMFGFGGRTYWGTMPFTDYPNYMGIIPLALALYGARRARGAARAYWIGLAAVALMISFGKHVKPLYELLYQHVPYFNKFRVPVMILVLLQFAVAVLAALGLDLALTRGRGESSGARAPARESERAAKKAASRGKGDLGAAWMRAAIFAGAGTVGLVVLLQLLSPSILATASKARPWMNAAAARQALDMATVDALRAGILLTAAFAVIAFERRGRLTRAAAALLVVGLTAVDLWTVDRKIIDPQLGSRTQYAENFSETPEVTFLRGDTTEFRVLPLEWNDSRLAAYGIASVLGYHPAKPRLYQAFMDTVGLPNLRVVRLLNVKYVLTDGYYPDTTGGVTLRHDGPVKVYEIQGALPRAYVVHRVRPVKDESTALAFLRAADFFDPRSEAVWTEPPPYPALAQPSVPDSVTRIRYDLNGSEYLVSTAAPGLFVQGDQFDPDWSATIDGKPAQVHRVNYLMRGILVPPGVHQVRLRYLPEALTAGIKVSAASAALALLLGIAGVWLEWRARRAPRRAPPERPS